MTRFKQLLSTFIVALAAVIVGITAYGLIKDKPADSAKNEVADTTAKTTEATKEKTSSATQETTAEAKKVFTKADIEKATDLTLTVDTVQDVQEALSKDTVWQDLGYPTGTAQRVAARFNESQKQAQGILREVATENDESLKVIVLEKTVNIGTTDDNIDFDTDAEETATETALGNVKELDVEFDFGQNEIDFDWEIENNERIDANYENDLTNERLSGKDAQAFVEKIVSGIDFKNSSKEDVYKAISKKLNLKETDLKSFKYEVTLVDQTEIENSIRF